MPITVDINTIQPYTLANTPILAIPFAILYVQAYLLLKYGPTSRLARLALIPFSLSSIKNAWLDHRVTDERYVIWNFVLGCAAVFYTVISLVYSTLRHGPERIDSSGPAYDALHLITSTRLIGWIGGLPVTFDPYPSHEPRTDIPSPREGERLTQRQVNRKALRVHAQYALAHWLLLDSLTFAFHTFGRHGIGSPRGGSIYASAASAVRLVQRNFPALFRTSWAPLLTWCIRQGHIVFVHFCTGMAFYQGLCLGYHLAALGGLGLLGQDAGQWPRLMDRPLMADSLLQFWGKRWHQIFRQAFVAPSLLLPARYRSLASPLIAFSISSLMHEMGTFTMVGRTSPRAQVTRSFLLFGLGMTAEIAFKKLTGRRVRGWAGRIWFWTFVIVFARGLVDAWLGFGVGGARLLPVWMSVWQQVGKAERFQRFVDRVTEAM
ncbi:hypothetical protein NCC49_002120 [Naganishia albida]|nr:hypothetical protein NCC49_002120 [Naganishia albida]